MKVFNPTNILIPRVDDFKKWSVVACDQYTSQKEYWDRVKTFVGDSPSSYNLIFPEAYLKEVDFNKKISEINEAMRKYLDAGVFTEYENSLVFIKRTFKTGLVRHGILGAVDLEAYCYDKDSTSPVRATEATVEERIPPRVTIRRNASLELPHVLLLIDDREDKIMEPLKNTEMKKLYDFELMEDGGHIEGYLVPDSEKVAGIINSLGTNPLIAVGDGNHSLAGAKACWEEVKKTLTKEEAECHPMRYALCEVINLSESSLVFEPIYRVLFDGDLSKLTQFAKETEGKYCYTVDFVSGDEKGALSFKSSCHIASGAVTNLIEAYIEKFGGTIDYIHGIDIAENFGKENGNIAFFNECLKKEDLFSSVNTYGPLPKKTFSMGSAEEKRFYLEARKLVL